MYFHIPGFSHYSAISKFSGQNTNGRSSIFSKQAKDLLCKATGVFPDARCLKPAHVKKNPLRAELKFVNRNFTTKGDKMFRSSWENGERGTPELRKIKPKPVYLSYSFIFSINSRLSIVRLFNFGIISPF
jgi:hypothetical protein